MEKSGAPASSDTRVSPAVQLGVPPHTQVCMRVMCICVNHHHHLLLSHPLLLLLFVVLFCVWSRSTCGAHRFVMVVSTCVVSSSLALPILFGALGRFGGVSSGWGHGGLRKPIGHHGISAYTEELEHFRCLVCYLFRCFDVVASICCVVLPLWVFLRILHYPHVLALLGDCLMVGT